MGIKFDGTITLGHVLTACTMLVMGFAAWRNLETRLVVLEVHDQLHSQQLSETVKNLKEVSETVLRLEYRKSAAPKPKEQP